MKKIFIFDLDGTLVNTLPDIRACLNYALEGFGLPGASEEQCKIMVGNGARTLCEKALDGSDTTDIDSLLSVYKGRYANHLTDFARPYDGIEQLLKELEARGIALAILTNKPQEQAEPIVDALFGKHRFIAVWGDNGARPRKPDPALMLQFLDEFEFSAEEAVFVGDSDVDILFANRAGVFSCGAAWGFRGKDELEKAGANLLAYTADDLLRAL